MSGPQMPPALSQVSARPKAFRDALQVSAAPVTGRAPTASDDSAAGYAVGDLWLAPSSAPFRVYQAAKVTTGAAKWLPLLIGSQLPLDLAPTASVAVGCVKLRSAYAGQCLRIQRASDTTETDIGFVNGVIDAAVVEAFLIGTTGIVVKWYDQSGNGNDLANATAANCPQIAPNYINGILGVSFSSETTGATFTNRWLINTVATFQPNRTAALLALRPRYSRMDHALVSFSNTAGAPGTTATYYGSASSYGSPGCGIAAASALSCPLPCSPVVAGYRQVSGTADFYAGNTIQLARGTASTATPVTGVSIGGVGTFPAVADYLAAIVWDRAVSSTEMLNARASLMQLTHIAPQPTDTVVAWGDSITAGQGSLLLRNRPMQELGAYGRPVRQYSLASSGRQATQDQSSTAVANLVGKIYAAAGGGRRFVVTFMMGTNDIKGGRTGAQVYADIASIATQTKALGANVRFVVSTITPRTDLTAGQATERDALNTLLRAGWPSFADALVDAAADEVMGNAAADTSLYVDGLHGTTLGYSYLAAPFANAVAAQF